MIAFYRQGFLWLFGSSLLFLVGLASAETKPFTIVLGISKTHIGNVKVEHLAEFSEQTGGKLWNTWSRDGAVEEGQNRGGFPAEFKDAMNQVVATGGRALFDLTRFDLRRALSRVDAYPTRRRITAWELQQLIVNPRWLAHTTFYLDGKPLRNDEVRCLMTGSIKPRLSLPRVASWLHAQLNRREAARERTRRRWLRKALTALK